MTMTYEETKNYIVDGTRFLEDVMTSCKGLVGVMDRGYAILKDLEGGPHPSINDGVKQFFKDRAVWEDEFFKKNGELGIVLGVVSFGEGMASAAEHTERMNEELPGVAQKFVDKLNQFQSFNLKLGQHPLNGRLSELAALL